MTSGSKEMNLDMHFLFPSKVPVKERPPGSPTGPLWRELPVDGDFFTYLSKLSQTFSKIKKFSPSLKGPRKGLSLHVPQKRGPNGNRPPFTEPYLAYLSVAGVQRPGISI